MEQRNKETAWFHLPGMFEHYEFYQVFLPLFFENREWFYPWAQIGSVYGAPEDCIWAGGRFEQSDASLESVLTLYREYGISARLTFSNSLLRREHLDDQRCNRICELFERKSGQVQNGVIVGADLLSGYLKEHYPNLYQVSSTTKVLTEYAQLQAELDREEFLFVVPDFRLNMQKGQLDDLSMQEKDKVELLCNECCPIGCTDRKACYENVSLRALGESVTEHRCTAFGGKDGYLFSKAMESPAFIGTEDITNWYLPHGFSNYKIEGRGLGSAVLLEFLLYYLVKPECQLKVREKIYLDSMLNLF